MYVCFQKEQSLKKHINHLPLEDDFSDKSGTFYMVPVK